MTKHKNGSYAPGLLAKDIQVYLEDGGIRVVDFVPFSRLVEGSSDLAGPTNVLFVLAPYSDFRRFDMHALSIKLDDKESLVPRAAVLGPDGSVSPFTSDALVLERSLEGAATQARFASIETWKQAEIQAFQAMHHLQGGHVVIRLSETQNPLGLKIFSDYTSDHILDYVASLELAPVFELVLPSMSDESSPNKAALSHEAVSHRLDLQRQLARHTYINEQTAGRSETSLADLIQDLERERAATYKLLVQPLHVCNNTQHSSRIEFASRDLSIKVFGPPMVVAAPRK